MMAVQDLLGEQGNATSIAIQSMEYCHDGSAGSARRTGKYDVNSYSVNGILS